MSHNDDLSPSELARRLASLPRKRRYPKMCAICGKEFVAARDEAVYCSSRCRWTAANRARSKASSKREGGDDAGQD